MSDKSTVSFGPGLPSCLFLLFTALKLTGYIDWSWWWVTAPLWGGLALLLAFVLCVLAVASIAVALENRERLAVSKQRKGYGRQLH